MTDHSDNPGDGERDDGDTTPEVVYEELEPFEPYTTGEVASLVDVPGRLARRLLEGLSAEGRIRKKEPEADRVIWIREPPAHACPECGREFEIRYFHPVLQSVQFCPRCGSQLE